MFYWFWELLYTLLKTILYCIDFIMMFAAQLAGIQPVTVDYQERDLLSFFFTSESVIDAFKLVSMVGIVLLFLFTAFAVIRSAARVGEGKSALTICMDASKSILYFLLVPAIMIIGGAFVTAVMKAVYAATASSGGTLGGAMFTLFADDACDGGTREVIMESFLSGHGKDTGFDYFHLSEVDTYFNLKRIDYFLGFVVGTCVLVMLVKPLLSFVERIVSLITLFIISPLSVSSSVLDDGARFKLWRDQVINKFLIAYGSLISINIFIIIVGVIYQVTFFPDSTFMNGLARAAFVLGGAAACKQGPILIGNLVNNGAGSQYAQDVANTTSPFARLGGFAGRALTHNPLSQLAVGSLKNNWNSAIHRRGTAMRSLKDEAMRNKLAGVQSQKFNDHLSDSRRSDFMNRHDWRRDLSRPRATISRDRSVSTPTVASSGSTESSGGRTMADVLRGTGGGDGDLNRRSADSLRSSMAGKTSGGSDKK